MGIAGWHSNRFARVRPLDSNSAKSMFPVPRDVDAVSGPNAHTRVVIVGADVADVYVFVMFADNVPVARAKGGSG